MATDPNQNIQDSRRAAMSFLNAAKAKEERRVPQNTVPQVDKTAVPRTKANPADDFLKAAKRKEAHDAATLADRVRTMSDAEFNEALKNGAITPEQLRKAGEYEWDTYMGDVWMENADNDLLPEPTYDEFMADPEKYGYVNHPDAAWKFDRYKSTVRQK